MDISITVIGAIVAFIIVVVECALSRSISLTQAALLVLSGAIILDAVV